MMHLSPEQEAIVKHPGSVYVKACPGAGKTRTLVSRAVRLAGMLPPSRGIALLSFTNSAAEEFKERLLLTAAPEVLKPPHFVGTIDSFLARFVVAPRGNPWAPHLPLKHVESWKRYKIRVAIGTTAKGKPDLREVPLSAFVVTKLDAKTKELTAELDFDRLARDHGRGVASELSARGSSVLRRAADTAARMLRAILAGGQVSPAEVRLLAAEFLLQEDDSADAHIINLAERFPKVVVDEAQDCDGSILILLDRLAQAGIEITLIADPEQCIYAWRGADPAGLDHLSRSWGEPLTLRGNYRSAPNICRAASSLKVTSSVDEPIGPNATCGWPVFVAPLKFSSPATVGQLFLALLRRYSIEPADAIVLAPTWSMAAAVAGAELSKKDNQKLGGKLRDACFGARQRPDSSALKVVRELVHEFLSKLVGDGVQFSDDPLVTEWLDGEARRLACDVLLPDPTRKDWYEKTLESLNTLRFPPGVAASTASVRKCLPKPSKPLTAPERLACEVAYSTIHQAKGREYAAVLLVLGRRADEKLKEFMSHWAERRKEGDRRAVAYVGVTRAERLLLVAAPEKVLGATQNLLRRDGATVELCEALAERAE